jgi:glycosyltransferase involved in cell wall biosynthesis
MKILLGHNFYREPGGEDASFQAEKRLLTEAGHHVLEYIRCNDEIVDDGLLMCAKLGLRTIWAHDTVKSLRTILREERPDIAHFHNTFPLISPAAYYACREAGVPVVQTLHNYRLLCPGAGFFRDGRVCQDCVEHNLWRGVAFACYRASRPATATVALMLMLHRFFKTWAALVDQYIAPSDFIRRAFLQAGMRAEAISVKPHCVLPDPGPRTKTGDYALFVGRLAPEKGVRTLLQTCQLLGNAIHLRIVGDGPLRIELEQQRNRAHLTNVFFDGWFSREQVRDVIKRARFLIVPSVCFETFAMTVIEAFACGVPVIASKIGALAETVENGRTGLHVTPDDCNDLAAKVQWAWMHPSEMEAMGIAGRVEYEAKYTAERNHTLLMEVYRVATGLHEDRKRAPTAASIRTQGNCA